MRYTFNEKEQKIEEELLGSFIQFPIRLAWAITVHKSQGLTFRHVRIDFTGGAFAGGQAYVALSRCTSLQGICLESPLRRSDIFVKPEVIAFAQRYNNSSLINKALHESKADYEYREAMSAFDERDFQAFLKHFFIAIHSRYDIERPAAQRLIRRKLAVITQLEEQRQEAINKLHDRDEMLKRLAVEYVSLGRECEKEHMTDAAIRNYEKALELYPEAHEASRRIKVLKKKK